MKRLFLVRHAKSSWTHRGLADFDRPLNKRGKKDAPYMGYYLKSVQHVTVDLMVASPAKRAWETALILAEALGYPVERIVWDAGIYSEDGVYLLGLLNKIEDVYGEVMVVGHNPDLTHLAEALSGTPVDNIPTCGVFGLAFEVSNWVMVGPGLGKTLFFSVPKQIENLRPSKKAP